MDSSTELFSEMDARSREVFQRVVESYLSSGEPMGSNTLTQHMTQPVSAATIRNVMKDLELLGLLDSPHTSAGRQPTELGLRMFVDGILEVGEPDEATQRKISATMDENDSITGMLDRMSNALSGLTRGASLVLAPKKSSPIKHIEFVSLATDRALVVLVFANGEVENRVFRPPLGQTPSQMREAVNFLNAIGQGRTLQELKSTIVTEIKKHRSELDVLTTGLVEAGVAVMQDAGGDNERLIVRGRSNLLENAGTAEDLERVRVLFDDLERKRDIAEFLQLTDEGEGVRIFIGSENKLFSLSGSSLVVSPYMNADQKVVGAIGVIGPTRLNYGRIVPIVNYTAQMVGRVLSDRG
ncbi:heat-inducible transcriptional repressor HrcA [Planktomarina temperata]|nr:heat-inducible transcriptional repressor HrcA [Planktomarina temperata]MDB0044278.1 heat-inducible transcriptional repressor HrcA [Planktomarina temperata]MDB4019322.1 heat-inducible transcriptional repressor HrcA [Planktomarina temperata]MDC1193012.1 heat-inducible transcriptional repressor HrcA [Planktomarina temperata]MDC1233742.1 heat-inducible transcriptional repressor HrcA [Planktomarina temperata]